MERIESKSEKETHDFALEYAKSLSGGDVLGLIGNLGAGKTLFTKAVAEFLGIGEVITSPTFVYMKHYEISRHDSIKILCHIDAYRIDNEKKLVDIGALEYIGNPEVLTVIEWSDKLDKLKAKINKKINIYIDKNKRIINLE